MNKEYAGTKKRYVGLDILRVASALVICMFHTTIHLGCDYGIFQNFSKMGAIFMTAFFMLSGFSLYVNWERHNLTDILLVKKFWKKRVFGILPMYWFISLIFVIMTIVLKEESIQRNLVLAPVEIIGLQSVFSSLFGFSHNDGTWFISCILICYFIYPFLQESLKQISKSSKIIVLIVCAFILLYSPIVVYIFQIESIYSNPFFRLLEFAIGIILASLKQDFSENVFVKKYIYNWWTVVAISVAMVVCVSFGMTLDFAIGSFTISSWISLPCFMIIIFSLSGVNSRMLSKSKSLIFLSNISYVFFLSQLFSNRISRKIIQTEDIDSNILKILIGWIVCLTISLCLRFIEIWFKTLINSKM